FAGTHPGASRALEQDREDDDQGELHELRGEVERTDRLDLASGRPEDRNAHRARRDVKGDDPERTEQARRVKGWAATVAAEEQLGIEHLADSGGQEEVAVAPPFPEMLGSGDQVDQAGRKGETGSPHLKPMRPGDGASGKA